MRRRAPASGARVSLRRPLVEVRVEAVIGERRKARSVGGGEQPSGAGRHNPHRLRRSCVALGFGSGGAGVLGDRHSSESEAELR